MSTDRAERPVWSLGSRRGWRRSVRAVMRNVQPWKYSGLAKNYGKERGVHRSGADDPSLEAVREDRTEAGTATSGVNASNERLHGQPATAGMEKTS